MLKQFKFFPGSITFIKVLSLRLYAFGMDKELYRVSIL